MKMILNKFRNCIKENKGFVMVDAMVAVLVLAIGLAALAYLYTNGAGISVKASTRDKAVHIAAAQIEKVKLQDKNMSYSDLANYVDGINSSTTDKEVQPNDNNESYTVKLTLGSKNLQDLGSTGLEGDQYIYPLTATVTWKNGTNTETQDITTYVTITKS